MTARKTPKPFAIVDEETVQYGKDRNKRPVLYEALMPVVAEAALNKGVSSWREASGHSTYQLRSAAKAWGYRVQTSTDLDGELLFRLNGRLGALPGEAVDE